MLFLSKTQIFPNPHSHMEKKVYEVVQQIFTNFEVVTSMAGKNR